MYENTEFTLSRDCEAIQIPSGQKTTIPAGTQGVITQSLGGSYTIATYQGLARVAENDLDALGLEKPQTVGLRLPVDQKTGRRHQSGSENDFDGPGLRNGTGNRARCAEQDSIHRRRG